MPVGHGAPDGAQHPQHDKAAGRHGRHRQRRADAQCHPEERALCQKLPHAAHQQQDQRVAHGDPQTLGKRFPGSLLYPAETVDQQRLDGQQGQIDAQTQQIHPKEVVQQRIHPQIDHRGTAAVDQAAGQQLLFQLFCRGLLIPQGNGAAQQAGQQPGWGQQQQDRHRQHHGIFSARGQHHQRSQTHALHDDRVVQEHTVMVGVLVRVADDLFCNAAFHSAASFPSSGVRRSSWYSRSSVRSIQPEMLLTTSSAKHTPVSYTPKYRKPMVITPSSTP